MTRRPPEPFSETSRRCGLHGPCARAGAEAPDQRRWTPRSLREGWEGAGASRHGGSGEQRALDLANRLSRFEATRPRRRAARRDCDLDVRGDEALGPRGDREQGRDGRGSESEALSVQDPLHRRRRIGSPSRRDEPARRPYRGCRRAGRRRSGRPGEPAACCRSSRGSQRRRGAPDRRFEIGRGLSWRRLLLLCRLPDRRGGNGGLWALHIYLLRRSRSNETFTPAKESWANDMARQPSHETTCPVGGGERVLIDLTGPTCEQSRGRT